jgi:hypothetical protein
MILRESELSRQKSTISHQTSVIKNQKPMEETATLQQTLEKACEGLLFMSESDRPFTFFDAGKAEKPLEEQLPEMLKLTPETPVHKLTLKRFFKNATTVEDWHTEEDKAMIQRFVDLQKALEDNLSNITVMRIGEIEIDCYLLGKTPEGNYAGLKTQAVET